MSEFVVLCVWFLGIVSAIELGWKFRDWVQLKKDKEVKKDQEIKDK